MMSFQNQSAVLSDFSRKPNLQPNQVVDVTLGLLIPFTGSLSFLGTSFNNSAQMAISDLTNIYPGSNFSLVTRDTATDATTTATAATELVSLGVTGVIGPASSSNTIASMSIFSTAQIPQISYSSTIPTIGGTPGSEYLFRIAPSEEKQGIAAADIANIFVSNFSIISNDGTYSPLLDAFTSNYFGSILADVRYPTGELDFSAEVTTLLLDNPRGIYIAADFSAEASNLIIELENQGFDGIILGDEALMSVIGNNVNLNPNYVNGTLGTILPTPSPDFISKYFNIYGSDPGIFGDYTYDAVMMMGTAIIDANSLTGPDIKASLFTVGTGYQGESGEISFDSNGEQIAGSYKIEQLQINNSVIESTLVGRWSQSTRSVTLFDTFDRFDIVTTVVVTDVVTNTVTDVVTIQPTAQTTHTVTTDATNTIDHTNILTDTTVVTSVITSTFTSAKSEAGTLGGLGLLIAVMFTVILRTISRRYKSN